MAHSPPTNKDVLADLISGDEARIIHVLSSYVVNFAVAVGTSESPSANGGDNCTIKIGFQNDNTSLTSQQGFAQELEFKHVDQDQLDQGMFGGAMGGNQPDYPVGAKAFYFAEHKIKQAAATTKTPSGGFMDPYLEQNELPVVTFPCFFLPPRLDNDVLVWASKKGLLRISVLSPQAPNEGDDMGQNLHQSANTNFSPSGSPWVWGPDDYRRPKRGSEPYISGGNRQHDICNVIGIMVKGTWHIYAQKTRPHRGRPEARKVVEVWRLYPVFESNMSKRRVWVRQ